MVTDTGDSPKEVVCVPHNSFASYFSSLLHFLTLQSPADLNPNPFPLPLQSMASHNHLDDDDDFGGDFPGPQTTRRSGSKRNFGDLEDDEDDFFGSKKANSAVEETAPGVATGMILALRESLQTCKDTLATYQTELEAAKTEIQKWHSSFQNESFIPMGTTPEPRQVINYLQTLKNSEESLREQLEKAKKKEGAFIVTFAKREQEIAELKSAVRDLKSQLKPPSMQARRLLLDPAIHEEFTRLKNLVEEKDKKVKELQDNIAAVQFTPQSKMGKMLMAKCRTLQEENEEIGNQAAEGKMHELAMKLALQKSQNAELRSQFEGLYTQMDGLSNDVERSNEMVVVLEEKLEEKDVEIQRLKQELLQQQKSSIEEKTTDSPTSNKKSSTEMSPGQDDN
ncbi:FKBP12-interacting protein of 37 kDa [Cannabis sativa]|uniref:FKBP12-interacting protein of 37 kDa n=1 Tax=Cannabis sativa TaxID=3483 RepID=UPI0029CA38FC|nr:FKBP12-interacting protein of 37 kDa [Cannabis sativa]